MPKNKQTNKNKTPKQESITHIQGKKKQSIETNSEKTQTLSKDFKSTILNMFKGLKEIMSKKLKYKNYIHQI